MINHIKKCKSYVLLILEGEIKDFNTAAQQQDFSSCEARTFRA